MRNVQTVLFAAVFFAAMLGCGKARPTIVPVQGVIRIDGKPLQKVAVRFVPQPDHGPDYIAVGVTDEAGRYTLNCKDQPGACVGSNQVLIREIPPPESLPKNANGHPRIASYYESLGGRPVPRKYADLVNSPLTAEVQAGRIEHDFDLSR